MPAIGFRPSGLIDAADWIRKRVDEFSVPQPPGNRLLKAQALMRDVNARRISLDKDEDATLQRITEAHWTILEQYIIARSLGRPGRRLSHAQLAKLEAMLSGADTEDDDRNPFARNTQFELYAGAILIMGDVKTWLAEPDSRFDYLGLEVGLAAKRIRSPKQLIKRAKEAVQQIKASGILGFVAMNVDVLVKAVGSDPTGSHLLDERLVAINEVDGLLSQHEEVVGSLIFARDAYWQFGADRPAISVSSTHRFAVYSQSPAEKTRGERFWSGARRRIDERLQNL